MILPGNDPDLWRIYHDKCIRDANVRDDEDGDERRLLQGEDVGPDIE